MLYFKCLVELVQLTSLICSVFLIKLNLGYDFVCPHISHWKNRAKQFCRNSVSYTCVLNLLTKNFEETCNGPQDRPKGYKAVLRYGSDIEMCTNDRFQPFYFLSQEHSSCVFKKRNCVEKGQIPYYNGSSTKDRICVCDIKQGFKPVMVFPDKYIYNLYDLYDSFCYSYLEEFTSLNEKQIKHPPNNDNEMEKENHLEGHHSAVIGALTMMLILIICFEVYYTLSRKIISDRDNQCKTLEEQPLLSDFQEQTCAIVDENEFIRQSKFTPRMKKEKHGRFGALSVQFKRPPAENTSYSFIRVNIRKMKEKNLYRLHLILDGTNNLAKMHLKGLFYFNHADFPLEHLPLFKQNAVDISTFIYEKLPNYERIIKKLQKRNAYGHYCRLALVGLFNKISYLDFICETGYIRFEQILLDNGKQDLRECTKDRDSSLYLECKQCHAKLACMLIKDNPKQRETKTEAKPCLFSACQSGDLHLFTTILKKSIELNSCTWRGKSILQIACEKGHVDIVKILLQYKNTFDDVEWLLGTSLYAAASFGHFMIVKLLLDYNANINFSKWFLGTPLYGAAEVGNVEIANFLLMKGANINKVSESKESPLYVASRKGHFKMVRLLLTFGAKVDQQTCRGETPLYVACREDNTDIARLLLEQGANKTIVTNSGDTPIKAATKRGSLNVVMGHFKRY